MEEKSRFSLSREQSEKVSELRKAFETCKDAGVSFIVTIEGLRAFKDPGIQIARTELGDEYPDEENGEFEVTDELCNNSVVVTDDLFYGDDSGDVIFLSDTIR